MYEERRFQTLFPVCTHNKVIVSANAFLKSICNLNAFKEWDVQWHLKIASVMC